MWWSWDTSGELMAMQCSGDTKVTCFGKITGQSHDENCQPIDVNVSRTSSCDDS